MTITKADLFELADVSARIGADPLLVQGPGGNTSLKSEDELWVKASGVWLAQAIERPIFAGLSLPAARQLAVEGSTDDFSRALLPGSDPGLRPSIETALHALMPHRVVLHAHAACSMTVSILEDGEQIAAPLLEGLKWAWISYARPGLDLASAVSRQIEGRAADILLLQNHGVVVGADSPLDAESLLREVEHRLALAVQASALSAPAPAAGETARYEILPRLAALAMDRRLFAIVTGAAFFPDQVVFLGGAVPSVGPGESLEGAADRVAAATGVPPVLLLQEGIGAFGACGRNPSANALIDGLFEVARRVPVDARIAGLTEEAVAALLDWEAEAYRVNLADRDKA